MSERLHYSNKGSHKERSDFWKQRRREQPGFDVMPDKQAPNPIIDNGWLIRRDMPRMPRTGKK